MHPHDGKVETASIRNVRIHGSRLLHWLFEHAAAEAVEAPTGPVNVAMRTVCQRAGWKLAGSLTEFDREWVMYRITRRDWAAQRQRAAPEP
jgi:RimJ/RimL family protein N-acetyltransferase